MKTSSRYNGAAVLGGCLIVMTIVLSVGWTAGGIKAQRSDVIGADVKESCHSRGEFGRYLPPLSQEPSTALAQALADYERWHGQCLLSDAVHAGTSIDPFRNNTCKYLLYVDSYAGLGNRIMSLVSAFLYALLTDRVLLLDTRGYLAKLLCQPFAWQAGQGFPYSRLLAMGAAGADLSTVAPPQPWVYLAHLGHDQSLLERQFWTPASQERLASVPWIAWSSNQYQVPRLFTLPSLWPRLFALFPSHPSLTFSHLARYLLLPADDPWRHILNAHSAHLAASNLTLGLQVRPHFVKPKGAFSRPAFDRIMKCLTINMSVGSSPQNETEHANGTTMAIMVASLQGRYYEEIKKAFSSSALVSVHTLSKDQREKHTWNQFFKAFVEMWVLSMCDELATSSWSTFGYVSRGLRGRSSWLLHVRADLMKTPPPKDSTHAHVEACSFQQSPDPCNHYPFFTKENVTQNPTLLNTSLSMVKWDIEHLLPCLDWESGIQLVDT